MPLPNRHLVEQHQLYRFTLLIRNRVETYLEDLVRQAIDADSVPLGDT